ncbi:LytR/AlgR family response regulator transcription factor [Flavobacterium sp.]|uniref:LytR/AlgR family response regulator transcription factor n=1 Tax=Flavobacterium sp. TaxID=239 RepID=UPI003526E3CD
MTILIIEDEKPAARMLQRKIEKLGFQVNQLLHSVEESIHWLKNNPHPDLLFLDIQLSDGLSFEIFDNINLQSAIIFTTAYDEYALKAFKLNSVDYLLKPIDDEELESAISKFQNQFQKNSISGINFDAIKQMLTNPIEKTYKTRYSFKIGNQIKIISIDQIACFYSENKGTYIHTYDNRDYLIDETLDEVVVELNPTDFFRINRQVIVAFKAISEIQVHTNSRLKLHLQSYTKDDLIVARERVNDFKNWIS